MLKIGLWIFSFEGALVDDDHNDDTLCSLVSCYVTVTTSLLRQLQKKRVDDNHDHTS